MNSLAVEVVAAGVWAKELLAKQMVKIKSEKIIKIFFKDIKLF